MKKVVCLVKLVPKRLNKNPDVITAVKAADSTVLSSGALYLKKKVNVD